MHTYIILLPLFLQDVYKRQFQISLPEFKAKAFPVHAGRRKIIPAGRKRRLFRLAGQRLFCGNISDVVAALGFGNNIALCGKLKISVFHCCAAVSYTHLMECIRELEGKDASVSWETEVVQLAVSRSKSVGRYHMMMGENPIYRCV